MQPTSRSARFARRGGATVSVATAALLVLAGCSTGGGTTAGGSGSAVSASTLASLQKTVDDAKKSPVFVAPGASLTVGSSLKGKKIMIIPVSSEIEYCAHVSEDLASISKDLGMTATNFENSTGPAGWIQGVNQAINQHYDAIALVCGIDPATIAPQMAAAKAAGIPVVDYNLNDESVATPSTISASTSLPDHTAMKLSVDAAVLAGKGKAVEAMLITSNENVPAPGMVKAAQTEMTKVCPSCTLNVVNIPISDWATKIQSTVSSTLISRPKTTAVILVYDATVPLALPAVKSSGRTDVKIYGFGGTISSLKLMQTNKGIVGGIAGTTTEWWAAYTTMDQVVRVVSGNPALSASKAVTPLRFWTPDNVSELGKSMTTEYVNSTFGDDFKKLWGVN
jgi:ribose transport system substrate-binding protein